jgi:glycosyltransferase involved in cell wall biosynthesis
MKVVFLTNFLPPYRIPVLSALAKRVDQLTVLVSTRMEANRAWDVNWGSLDVRLQRCWTLLGRWRHPAGFSEQTFVHIPYDTLNQLRRIAPDVMVSAELGLRTAQAVVYRKMARRCRLLVHVDGSEMTELGRGMARNCLRKMILRHADACLVNGASGSRYVQGMGVAQERITITPYPTDATMFGHRVAAHRPTDTVRLLYVGASIERKGLIPFARALATWAARHAQRRVTWRLAGGGSLATELRQIAWPENVAVELLGSVAYDRLADVYAESDVLVFPTLSDTWGMVVNEAMASGIPVLGSRYSQAVEELVREGQEGWLFYPDRDGEILKALERAMDTTPERRRTMGRLASQRALQVSPERVADKIVCAMEQVVQSGMGQASHAFQ